MKLAMLMLILITVLPGCGDATDGGGADLSAGGGPCVHDTDCPAPDFTCAYAIADGCSAKGHCARFATPTCASIVELCGCDGSKVPSGACFYQPGYAGGPTTGAGALMCSDGGS